MLWIARASGFQPWPGKEGDLLAMESQRIYLGDPLEHFLYGSEYKFSQFVSYPRLECWVAMHNRDEFLTAFSSAIWIWPAQNRVDRFVSSYYNTYSLQATSILPRGHSDLAHAPHRAIRVNLYNGARMWMETKLTHKCNYTYIQKYVVSLVAGVRAGAFNLRIHAVDHKREARISVHRSNNPLSLSSVIVTQTERWRILAALKAHLSLLRNC